MTKWLIAAAAVLLVSVVISKTPKFNSSKLGAQGGYNLGHGVIWDCSKNKWRGDRLSDWPGLDSYSPRYWIRFDRKISDKTEFDALLDSRPLTLKAEQNVIKTFEIDGWFLASLSAYDETTSVDNEIIVRAYAMKKGSKELLYWFSW